MASLSGARLMPLALRSSMFRQSATTFPSLSHVGCLRITVPPKNFLSIGGRRTLTSSKKPITPSNKTVTEKSTETPSSFQQRLKDFLGPKEMPPRWTPSWYREMVLLCTVFAITGSSTMVLVRPAVSKGLGLEGSFKEGPWSFRICSIVVMTPIYATLLVCVGTVFGRHSYFRHFSVKMWSRFGIPPEVIDATYHQTKKTFRKY